MAVRVQVPLRVQKRCLDAHGTHSISERFPFPLSFVVTLDTSWGFEKKGLF